MYELDKTETGWHRLNRLINNFGHAEFFSVAFGLFGCAFEDERNTKAFWREFIPHITIAVLTANFRHFVHADYHPKKDRISLLCLAIELGDLSFLRIVLNKWSELLMRNTHGPAAAVTHLCSYIDKDEIISLSDTFPADFESFLCGLSQVKAHGHADKGAIDVSVLANEFLLTGVGGVGDFELIDPSSTDIWGNVSALKRPTSTSLGSKRRSKFPPPLTASYLPLHFTAHIDMIKAYSETCHILHSVTLFESDIAVMSVEYAWRNYARRVHLFYLGTHVALIIVYSYALYLFEEYTNGDTSTVNTKGIAYALQLSVLLIAMIGIKKDVRRLFNCSEGVISFFSDIWNVSGAVTNTTAFVGSLTRLINGGDTEASRGILSITSIFIWLQLLYFFTVFRSTGPLVAMILRMASGIQIILLIVFLVIVGFSQAFWVLSDPLGGSRFKTIGMGFLTSFQFMMGGFSPTEFDTSYCPELAVALSILFMIVVAILLLNLVIAMMASNFEAVKEHSSGERYLLLADRVIDIAAEFTPTTRVSSLFNPKTIHALRLSSDYVKMKVNKGENS